MSEINLNTPEPVMKNVTMCAEVTVKTACASVSDTDSMEVIPEDSIEVIAGMFFDGTYNNKNNVIVGMAQKNAGTFKNDSKDTSYDFDFSNIARGERAYNEEYSDKLLRFKIYIEGIGTEDNEKDVVILGGGAAVSSTGITAKVKKGCKRLAEKIAEHAGGRKIWRLTVDSFGFSRGAAAARNFIHEISKREGSTLKENYGELGKQLASNDVEEVRSISIRFTGLYDTVASYGAIRHSNDTPQLNLAAVAKSLHVLQLVADDEHRENFRLTNINSAGGVEKFLPGVHADIGGGYTDNTHEDIILDYKLIVPGSSSANKEMEKEREYFIEQGWYNEKQLLITNEIRKSLVPPFFFRTKVLGANRMVASKEYSYIPLHIMTKYAIDKNVDFDMEEINKHQISGDLSGIKTRLENYVMNNDDSKKLSYDNPEDKELVKWLRNIYLHFSSHYQGIIETNKPALGRERGENNG